MEFVDKILKCVDCGNEFVFTAGEQLFFHDKQFRNDPKRCKLCKAKRASGGSAVRAETRRHDYDEVILATGRQEGSRLAHVVGRDPVQRLRRQWGQRLIVFPTSPPQS